MTKLVRDQLVVQATSFLQFWFFQTQQVSQPVWNSVLGEIGSKMTSVQGCSCFCNERSSAALSIAPLDFSPPPELSDKLSDQLAGPSRIKPPIANAPIAATSIPKYFKDDLQ